LTASWIASGNLREENLAWTKLVAACADDSLSASAPGSPSDTIARATRWFHEVRRASNTKTGPARAVVATVTINTRSTSSGQSETTRRLSATVWLAPKNRSDGKTNRRA
jgi:hypothetical protein